LSNFSPSCLTFSLFQKRIHNTTNRHTSPQTTTKMIAPLQLVLFFVLFVVNHAAAVSVATFTTVSLRTTQLTKTYLITLPTISGTGVTTATVVTVIPETITRTLFITTTLPESSNILSIVESNITMTSQATDKSSSKTIPSTTWSGSPPTIPTSSETEAASIGEDIVSFSIPTIVGVSVGVLVLIIAFFSLLFYVRRRSQRFSESSFIYPRPETRTPPQLSPQISPSMSIRAPIPRNRSPSIITSTAEFEHHSRSRGSYIMMNNLSGANGESSSSPTTAAAAAATSQTARARYDPDMITPVRSNASSFYGPQRVGRPRPVRIWVSNASASAAAAALNHRLAADQSSAVAVPVADPMPVADDVAATAPVVAAAPVADLVPVIINAATGDDSPVDAAYSESVYSDTATLGGAEEVAVVGGA
jgi:hypothetical protein